MLINNGDAIILNLNDEVNPRDILQKIEKIKFSEDGFFKVVQVDSATKEQLQEVSTLLLNANHYNAVFSNYPYNKRGFDQILNLNEIGEHY